MINKSIFITGATSGIGRLIAENCLKKGFVVYGTGRDENALQSLAQLGVHVLKADLSELEEIENVFKQLPSIDVAILNAGVGYFQNAFDLTDDEISSMIDVNVKAPILLANRFAKK